MFSARYCFVENLHKRFDTTLTRKNAVYFILFVYSFCSGVMDNAEYACYCKLFDSVTAINPPKVDLIGELLLIE